MEIVQKNGSLLSPSNIDVKASRGVKSPDIRAMSVSSQSEKSLRRRLDCRDCQVELYQRGWMPMNRLVIKATHE
jgi:hypothetical protein